MFFEAVQTMRFIFVTAAFLLQTAFSLPAPWQVLTSDCVKFPSPTNGLAYCRTDYCVVRCNDGFQFEKLPADGYFCHPHGVWSSVPPGKNVPWPNCTQKDDGKQMSDVYTAHAVGPGTGKVKLKQSRKPKLPDTVPPSITNCPHDINKISDTDPVQATWDEPDISDNSGVFISIASISSGSLFRYGTHNVQYTANDEAGNEASCQFKVIIQKPDPLCTVAPPSDGALACGTLHYPDTGNKEKTWQFCIPLCIKGTDFHRRPGLVSFCKSSQSTSSWFHLDQSWQTVNSQMPQSCIVRRRAGSRRGDDLQFYEGDCNEMPVHSQILFRVGQMLAKDPFVLSQCALKPETCEKYWVSDSTVHCGPGDNQKDTEPPVVISCPQNIELETQRGNPYWNNLPEVSWKEPVFEDNSREPLKITKEGSSVNSGDKLAYGQYSVVYTATDSSGNTAKCSFQITVKPMACTMELPEYGAIVCGYPTVEGMDLLTIDCIVLCRSKHQFNRNPYPIYACSEEGLWWTLTSTFDPIGPHLPSLNYTCRESDVHTKPKPADENFYFDGDCHDREVQEVLMGHLEYFQRRTSAYQYCQLNRDSCRKWKGYRNVTVFCGGH